MNETTGALVIKVDGLLDVATARDLILRIRCAVPERDVVIEFGTRAACDVVALSMVAGAIRSPGARVSVRGLAEHEHRILRYLGVPVPVKPGIEPGD
jgi:hypothetical protein